MLVGETDYAKDMNLPGIVNNITSNHFFYLKNSFLAGYSRAGRFLVCTEEDSITISDFYPSLDEPEQYKKVEHRYYLFLGCMAVKPDGNMFVHATRTGCIFEIWKYRGKNLSPYVIKGFFRPNYLSSDRDKDYPNVLPNEKDAYGISVLSCTNKYIYAEYNNIPGFSSNKIAVFDWEGEPQKLYSVNKEIYTFYVDDDTTAYGLAMNDNNDIELITIPLK